MAQYLSGSYTTTYTLTTNTTTVTSTGVIDVNSTTADAAGVLGTAGLAWTLTNLGTVESIGSQGIGVDLLSGGFITNGATGSPGGLIEGSYDGVLIGGAAGAVVNYGTITSTATGTNGNGVYLSAGGAVTNLGVIHGVGHGVLIAGGAGTIVNSGSISNTVALHAGGTISNSGSADIASGQLPSRSADPPVRSATSARWS